MRSYILSIIITCFYVNAFAQKPIIDTNSINNWVSVRGGTLSKNSKFYAYSVINGNSSSHPFLNNTILFIGKVNNAKVVARIPGGKEFNFTGVPNTAVFIRSDSILTLFNLDNDHSENIPDVTSYEPLLRRERIAFLSGQTNKKLHIVNLADKSQIIVDSVADYEIVNDGNCIIFKKNIKSTGYQEIYWLNPVNGRKTLFWKGAQSNNFIFAGNNRLAFKVNGSNSSSIYFFDHSYMKYAEKLIDDGSLNSSSNAQIGELQNFSKDENRLFFSLAARNPSLIFIKRPNSDEANVDVWSYTDTVLQSQQLDLINSNKNKSFLAVIGIKDRKVIQLEKQNEHIGDFEPNGKLCTMYIFRGDESGEQYWNQAEKKSNTFLESTSDGHIITQFPTDGQFSPGDKYYIYFDHEGRNCFSYNLLNGKTINLTEHLPVPIIDQDYDDAPGPLHGQFDGTLRRDRSKTWLLKDRGYLLYDKYDIWLTDPSGQSKAINLTNGYGRKNNIIFSLAVPSTQISGKGTLLLFALDNITGQQGFFSINLDKIGNPILLKIGTFNYEDIQSDFQSNDHPLNKIDRKLYIFRCDSLCTSPNYFITEDFKSFKSVSNVHPEKDFNWLSSQLLNWQGLDGYPLKGIMYRPENFDPNKKYPVIFTFYEKMFDNLDAFIYPELAHDRINIPWFVSRGYIVVNPEIHYKMGRPGQSVVNSILGAFNYLKSLSYIDSTKMGIQGHSFGGFETNYLVTHTNVFAAAMSASGLSDLVSDYNSVAQGNPQPDGSSDGGQSLQGFADIGQVRIGETLWANPDLYIDNSPVFEADKVTTPLLMMGNKMDGIVPFEQAVEFFTALRRLGKKVWMLQYDGQNHLLINRDSQLDYTTRMTQFFDHYLKDKPAPLWMTRGIPAVNKGIDNGLDYDKELKTPPISPLIDSTKDPKIIYNFN